MPLFKVAKESISFSLPSPVSASDLSSASMPNVALLAASPLLIIASTLFWRAVVSSFVRALTSSLLPLKASIAITATVMAAVKASRYGLVSEIILETTPKALSAALILRMPETTIDGRAGDRGAVPGWR